MAKPILLVTRRLPPVVESRALRDYEARLNPEDAPRSGADILRLADGAAAILCCPAEQARCRDDHGIARYGPRDRHL